jgi:DNA-binding protein HU-beta
MMDTSNQNVLYLPYHKNYFNMNKSDLITKISEDAGITKAQANGALNSFTDAVTKTLNKGDKVTLVGFGTFSVANREARNGRNPKTNEAIKIKAKKVARFKAGKELAAKIQASKTTKPKKAAK